MAIILKGVNPTTFNLVASLIAEVLQLAGALTLCALLHLLVSIYMRKGNKIPVQALGPMPAGLLDAWHFAKVMKWSWPATLALFLFLSEYATAVAFAGLGFVEVDQEGIKAPVLNLTRRNNLFPYEAIGDPSLPFTASRLELLLGSPTEEAAAQQEILQLAAEEVMVASFLGAADSIAQGSSAFLEQSEELVNNPTLLVVGQDTEEGSLFSNLEDSTVLYGSSSFLAGISLEIPLDCSNDALQDTPMTSIEEYHGPDNWKVHTMVPNCTVTGERKSGMYGGVIGKTEITSYGRVGSGIDAKLLVRDQQVGDRSTFLFPYEGLQLARERRNFREGRRVFGFGGVKIGETEIPFDITVVSTGKTLADPPSLLDPEDKNVRSREYFLVSKVKEEEANCPKDPSGSEDSLCLITVKITCETFGSELGNGGLLQGDEALLSNSLPFQLEHNCLFDGDVEIIWGTGYDVDQQLLAAVAGIQARNTGWASSLRQQRTLSIHSIPAALFMLGSLDSRSSVDQVKSTTIDGIFIAFMCVPVGLCMIAGAVYLSGMKYLLPIPGNGGSLVELGADIAHQQDQEGRWLVFKHLQWNGQNLTLDPVTDDNHYKGQPREFLENDKVIHDDDSDNTRNGPTTADLRYKEHTRQLMDDVKMLKAVSGQPRDAANEEKQTSILKEEAGMVEDTRDVPVGSADVPPASSDMHTQEQPRESLNMRAQMIEEVSSVSTYSAGDAADPTIGGADSQEERLDVLDKGQKIERTSNTTEGAVTNGANTGRADKWTLGGSMRSMFLSGRTVFEEEHKDTAENLAKLKDEGSDTMYHNGISVTVCIFFCMMVTLIAVAFISTRSVDSGTASQSEAVEDDFGQQNLPEKDVLTIPSGCFHNNSELRTALSGYLHGSGDAQADIKDQYGPFEHWCVDYVNDFSFLFAGVPKLQKLNASLWNVSEGQSFAFCFYKYDFSEDVFDISSWDLSSGTDFGGMFYQVRNLDANLSAWNVSSGVDFNSMFHSASTFNSDLSQWDVSSGAHFKGMFQDASAFNCDLAKWEVSNGISFQAMFMGAENFNSNLSQWDVSSGTDFGSMFSGARSFDSDLSSWDVSTGIDFGAMFHGASSFTSDLSQWNVTSGQDFSRMFEGSTTFTSDISHWDVSSGRNFQYMFSSALSFASNLSEWDVSSGSSFGSMFYGTASFNADLSKWNVSSATDFSWMFYNGQSFNSDLSKWDVAAGANFAYMFYEATSFNSNLSSWLVSSGADFSGMFREATSFTSDLSRWDVSSGTSFSEMFSGAAQFNSDLSTWDVSLGTSFDYMFSSASSFDSDLSHWDVSSGTDFGYMLAYATSFNSNLCSWYNQLGASDGTDNMLLLSGCSYEDISSEYMCQICAPTPAPSGVPSQAPTSTVSPSFSMLPTTSTVKPSASPTINCIDLSGWVDIYGDGCVNYIDWGCSGAEFYANDDGKSALDACCLCGGGSTGTSTLR